MSVPYPMTLEDIKHAEAVLLGSLLLYPEQGTLVQTVLQPEDFFEDRHRLIYEALLAIPGTAALESIHAVKILLSDHELEHIGSEAYLTMLKQQAESMSMSIENQVYLLKQASLHRILMQVGEELHTRTMHYESDDLMQLIGKLEQAKFVAQQLLSPMQPSLPHVNPLQTDLETHLADLGIRRKQHTTISGLPTGFADLDTVIGGLQRSDLIIIAGPPSIGKTSFALSIALHVLLKEHRSVGLFSLEAPKKTGDRALALDGSTPRSAIASLARIG
jgi:replicative DNA helicase